MGRKRIYATPEEKAAAAKARYMANKKEPQTNKAILYKGYTITYITKKYNGIVCIDFNLMFPKIEQLDHNIKKIVHSIIGEDFSKKMIVSVDESEKGNKQRCELVLKCLKSTWNECVESCVQLIDNINEPIFQFCQDCLE